MVEFALSNCQSVKLTGRTMKISEFGDLCGILLGRSAWSSWSWSSLSSCLLYTSKQRCHYAAVLKIAGLNSALQTCCMTKIIICIIIIIIIIIIMIVIIILVGGWAEITATAFSGFDHHTLILYENNYRAQNIPIVRMMVLKLSLSWEWSSCSKLSLWEW